MVNLSTMSSFWAHIDWSMVSAFAALLAALGAFATVWRQDRLTHFSVGIEMLHKLENTFTSDPHLLTIRATAAKALLSGTDLENVDDLLDFFQTVAFLHYRKAVDTEMVWASFDPWLRIYWYASAVRIEEYRKVDPTAWLHVDSVFRAIGAMQARMAHISAKEALPSPEYIKQYLTWESELADNH